MAVLAFASSVLCGAPAPPDVLFGKLDSTDVKLSPNGRMLAVAYDYGEKEERRTGLAVVDIATKQTNTIVRERDASVGNFDWVGDERLLAGLYGRWGEFGFYAMSPEGKGMREILPLGLNDYSDPRLLLPMVATKRCWRRAVPRWAIASDEPTCMADWIRRPESIASIPGRGSLRPC